MQYYNNIKCNVLNIFKINDFVLQVKMQKFYQFKNKIKYVRYLHINLWLIYIIWHKKQIHIFELTTT